MDTEEGFNMIKTSAGDGALVNWFVNIKAFQNTLNESFKEQFNLHDINHYARWCGFDIETLEDKIVINGFGKFMLPVDADEIIPAMNQKKNSTILAFVNNNKVYFCIRGEKICPTNGIPRENVVGYAILTEEDEAYQTLLIGIKINNKRYKVYYIPRANNIPNIQTPDNVEVTDEVERNNVEKLFFPEKIQISEQFRDLINRMDIL
jgi:hypothetical protein